MPTPTHSHNHDQRHPHSHVYAHEHGHSHGLIHESIVRSKDGVRVVSLSLGVLLVGAFVQTMIFLSTNSVSLLADLIHNFGDALTALPLGAAFLMRNRVIEKRAGYFVVATIFISACVAAVEAISRFIHPQPTTHLLALAIAGLIGFASNEIAAIIRLRGGKRLDSPALIADGHHARADGFVSLSVLCSAILVAAGFPIADPLIGLLITLVILRITRQSYLTIRADRHSLRPSPTNQ